MDVGIKDDKRRAIANGLCVLLADSYTLYLKTHNFHWNVTGPHFQQLHLMFETQYNELALAVDAIAERIRALDEFAPGSYREFSKLSTIKESTGVPKWEKMVKELVGDHEAIAKSCRAQLGTAQKAGDESTAGILAERMNIHEKTAWMLRSLLA